MSFGLVLKEIQASEVSSADLVFWSYLLCLSFFGSVTLWSYRSYKNICEKNFMSFGLVLREIQASEVSSLKIESAKVWELPPWTTQNQTSISLKSSPPFSTFNKKISCLETRWPAYRISHHLLPQYFLLLQWPPESPRSICHKSLMERASNFEALSARYS